MAWLVAGSAALHSAVLLLLVWPMLRGSLEAAPPAAIDVELVATSSEAVSAEPASAEPSQEEEESAPTEASSMAAAPVEPTPSEPVVAEAPSGERSTPEQPSAAAGSAQAPPSAAPTPDSPQPPVAPVPRSRPAVIAVGSTGEVATDSSGLEPNGAGELTAESGDASAGETAAPAAENGTGAAVKMGELHVARTFYLAQILDAAAMANVRDALERLPHDKRLSQTCNIEAIGQVANAGKGFSPDAVIVDAFSKSTISGTRLSAEGAIFRSQGKWYALAFDCTLNDDLTEITEFTFRLGPDVTSVVTGSGSARNGE